MAKPRYLKDANGKKFYPVGHTKAIYDNNGKLLEDRLTSDENNIKNKVDKVSGKDLSDANYTNAEKTKLANITEERMARWDTIPKQGEKGEQGAKGDTGAAAGFGTVTATMGNASTGTPSVSVSTSGSNTAKNFAFTFSNLKGEKGDKGNDGSNGTNGTNGKDGTAATITVGSVTSGTSPSVKNSGTTTAAKFDFVLPKGDKGDKGDQGCNAATIVVASSTSRNKAQADYICTGTNDQTIINNAINALPSTGGKIVLLEGTYDCGGTINMNKPNVVIEGMGRDNTTLICASAWYRFIDVTADRCGLKGFSTSCTVKDSIYSGIYLGAFAGVVDDVEVRNFNYGINITQLGGFTHCNINNVYSIDNNFGVHVNSMGCIVSNCFCINNAMGIDVEANYNKLSNNYIIRGTGQPSDYESGHYSIWIKSWARYNDVSNNYILGKNYVNEGGDTNTFSNNRYEKTPTENGAVTDSELSGASQNALQNKVLTTMFSKFAGACKDLFYTPKNITNTNAGEITFPNDTVKAGDIWYVPGTYYYDSIVDSTGKLFSVRSISDYDFYTPSEGENAVIYFPNGQSVTQYTSCFVLWSGSK